MDVPDWRLSNAGTKVRVALWLVSEVGETGRFTKRELREAFPNVEQVDRRMRDLRTHGWIINTANANPELNLDELELRQIGDLVWDSSAPKSTSKSVSPKARLKAFSAAGFACEFCGIPAGERYSDGQREYAQLQLSYGSSNSLETPYVTCLRCRKIANAEGEVSLEDDLRKLDPRFRWLLEASKDEISELRMGLGVRRRLSRLPQAARARLLAPLD